MTPDLQRRLLANADYMADNPPATIETDSDLWRTAIQLQRDAASALAAQEEREAKSPDLHGLLALVASWRKHSKDAVRQDRYARAAFKQCADELDAALTPLSPLS